MKSLSKNQPGYTTARKRVRQLKKFYESLGFFVFVFIIYGIWKYSQKHYEMGQIKFLEFNNWSVVFWIWGLVLILKAIKLFFFNQNWERRMMDKELNK